MIRTDQEPPSMEAWLEALKAEARVRHTAGRTDQDRADFEAFVKAEKAEEKVHKSLYKRGVPQQEAGDITQFALMRLWERWDDTPEDERLKFSYHVAKQRWIDWLRSRQHRTPLVDPMADWLLESEDPHTDPATLSIERQHVIVLVNTLPPKQRTVFAFALDGLKPRQIAREVGLSEATVRSHLRHGRERLRLLLLAENSV
jgi:RNA polymerase sigma factor (sigma-70 family)